MALTFVDTGAFLALLSQSDKHHNKATDIYARLIKGTSRLITTNHVIDETCTWLMRNGNTGHKIAVEFGQSMLKSPNVSFWNLSDDPPANTKFIIVSTPPEIERRALAIFSKYDTTGFSFTDCISFALMQKLAIRKTFAFDSHFDILGFERI